MAVQTWTSELDGGEGQELIRRCLTRINLAIDEEISNSHQLYARDQGPGRLVRAQLVSVLARRTSHGSNSFLFEVRSAESSLVKNSRCQEVAKALQAEINITTSSPETLASRVAVISKS
jgi:hypothetical protein